ncbi:MAG: amino acid ABC transporter ATP-binding protein [Pirellulales bacterium]
MIDICDIRKRFGDLQVLDGVTMSIAAGTVSVLLGPSGSGKSTLLRTINGLETFDSGEIRVNDIVLDASPGTKRDKALKAIRCRVGLVFQQFYLFPHRTVLENVIEGPVCVLGQERSSAIKAANTLLDRVGMLQKANVKPGTLSGGQQQRVAIARALAMQPEAILFDEPTSALDPEMTAEVTAVMADLARAGQTMIVVTHDMGFAQSIANQVFVLDRGKIVESGAPNSLFTDPQQETTKRLLRLAANK